ncbi:MAG TPA: hypothetical protein DET40_09220 [Lentisphaeria bacterium]|nr:MAG: hypothetical protein A2X45_08010 [Lentisphaerae bacterium GWF2_50_93]HCE43717.1 hypothetical protein [Lentisphaeria bacterium]
MIIGIDVLSVTAYIFGYCGLLSKTSLLAFFSCATLILAILFYRKTHSNPKTLRFLHLKHFLPLLIPFSILPLVIGRALCIPSGWDELTYQLEVPARWIQSGNLAFFHDNPYSAFPTAASASFYILMMTGGLLAPRIFIVTLWAISIVAMYLMLRPGFSKWHASLLTFGFGTSFTVLMAATSAYVELFILIQAAGMLLLLRSHLRNSFSLYIMALTGFMAGIAGGVKLTGLIIGAGFLLYVISTKKRLIKINSSALLVYLSVFIITALIFYARPFLMTGNPAYPYFAGLFSGNEAVIEMSRYHHLIGSVKYGIQGIAAFFTDPILLAISGDAFDGGFGLQFLVILMASAFSIIIAYESRNSRIAGLTITALAFYIFWFLTSQQSRFIIPAVFILFIVSKFSFRRFPSKIAELLIILILLLSIFSIPRNILKDCYLSWKTALGMINPQDYLYSATGPGYLKAVFVVNKKLPEDAKLMMLFENRGLYMNRKHLTGTPFFQEEFFTPPEKLPAPSRIMEILHENKITHLLVGLSENDPDRLPEYLERTANFANMIGELADSGCLKKIWEDEGFAIYEVK